MPAIYFGEVWKLNFKPEHPITEKDKHRVSRHIQEEAARQDIPVQGYGISSPEGGFIHVQIRDPEENAPLDLPAYLAGIGAVRKKLLETVESGPDADNWLKTHVDALADGTALTDAPADPLKRASYLQGIEYAFQKLEQVSEELGTPASARTWQSMLNIYPESEDLSAIMLDYPQPGVQKALETLTKQTGISSEQIIAALKSQLPPFTEIREKTVKVHKSGDSLEYEMVPGKRIRVEG